MRAHVHRTTPHRKSNHLGRTPLSLIPHLFLLLLYTLALLRVVMMTSSRHPCDLPFRSGCDERRAEEHGVADDGEEEGAAETDADDVRREFGVFLPRVEERVRCPIPSTHHTITREEERRTVKPLGRLRDIRQPQIRRQQQHDGR